MIRFVRWNSSMSQTRRINRAGRARQRNIPALPCLPAFVHFADVKNKKECLSNVIQVDGNMKKRKCLNRDWLCAIVLFLLIPVWMGLAPEWYSWLAMEDNGLWMKWLYNLLDGRCLVNLPVSVTIIYLAYCWINRIWIDNDCRPYRFPLVGGLLFCLNWKSNVVYANIIGGFDYRMLLTCILAIALVILIIKAFKSKVNTHDGPYQKEEGENVTNDKNLQGFSPDTTANQNAQNSLGKYASVIARRLLSTNISDQSYAIGITGEWGVGKTTFLNLLKKEIVEKAEIVHFNPWMCRSPEQVTNDFFSSLRHQLSPKYSTLSKSLKEYARSINNMTLTPHSAFGLELSLPIREESLYEKKKNLSDKFSRLPRPVVVVIDDIDRLEREEVFEVLRLIRNTADLSNTIYLVAYDKEYVTTVLEEKNIKDAASYLEKIFPVEVHLPKVEDYLIWETLYADLNCQERFNGRFTKSLFARFNNDERALILRVLNNYRRAKRFSRLYILNVDYVMEQCRDEIKLLDLFWLKLLQVYDKKVYDMLADDPYSLLCYENDRFNIKYNILQSSKRDGDKVCAVEKFWKDETPQLLEKLFGKLIKTRTGSICYPENYDKYFTLGVSPYRLSFKELKGLLTEGSKPEEIVNQWLDSRKYIGSITYQLSHVQIEALSDSLLENYLHGILFFALKTASPKNHQFGVVKKMLQADRYGNGDKKNIAHDFVLAWFNEKLDNEEDLFNLSGLLNRLYLVRTYDQDNHEIEPNPLVISNTEIEELLISVVQTYFDNHPELSAIELIKEGTTLFRLFKNCCLNTDDNIVTDGGYGSTYKQVAFKTVINHFEKKDEKPTFKEYEELCASLYSQETPEFTDPEEENAYWDYMEESVQYKMRKTFGNSYSDDLKEFKNRCFVNE